MSPYLVKGVEERKIEQTDHVINVLANVLPNVKPPTTIAEVTALIRRGALLRLLKEGNKSTGIVR